jgi:hypothetical protein
LTVGGETGTLTATVTPANATNKAVTWSSSDEDVATVSNTGVVTAVGAGEATITVTTVDGDKTDTCVITVTAAQPETWAVTYTLTNLTSGASPATVVKGDALNATLAASAGYTLPETITVTMGGEPLTADEGYTYNATSGAVAIDEVTGNVVVTASGVQNAFSVTYTLTNITTTGAVTVDKGGTLNAALTADTGYGLPDTITVTMGGDPLTAGTGYTYNSASGAIVVTGVTGDIVITAVGVDTEKPVITALAAITVSIENLAKWAPNITVTDNEDAAVEPVLTYFETGGSNELADMDAVIAYIGNAETNTTFEIHINAEDAANNTADEVVMTVTVTPEGAALTYTASANPSSVTFTTSTVDYDETALVRQITISNSGTGVLENLEAALGDSNFEIVATLSATTIDVGGSATISVQPVEGLTSNAAAYTDTLTITGDEGLSVTIALSFTVEDPEIDGTEFDPIKKTETGSALTVTADEIAEAYTGNDNLDAGDISNIKVGGQANQTAAGVYDITFDLAASAGNYKAGSVTIADGFEIEELVLEDFTGALTLSPGEEDNAATHNAASVTLANTLDPEATTVTVYYLADAEGNKTAAQIIDGAATASLSDGVYTASGLDAETQYAFVAVGVKDGYNDAQSTVVCITTEEAPATFEAVADGTLNEETSTKITLTFNKAVEGLDVEDIILEDTGGTGASITAVELAADDGDENKKYELTIAFISDDNHFRGEQGNVTFSIDHASVKPDAEGSVSLYLSLEDRAVSFRNKMYEEGEAGGDTSLYLNDAAVLNNEIQEGGTDDDKEQMTWALASLVHYSNDYGAAKITVRGEANGVDGNDPWNPGQEFTGTFGSYHYEYDLTWEDGYVPDDLGYWGVIDLTGQTGPLFPRYDGPWGAGDADPITKAVVISYYATVNANWEVVSIEYARNGYAGGFTAPTYPDPYSTDTSTAVMHMEFHEDWDSFSDPLYLSCVIKVNVKQKDVEGAVSIGLVYAIDVKVNANAFEDTDWDAAVGSTGTNDSVTSMTYGAAIDDAVTDENVTDENVTDENVTDENVTDDTEGSFETEDPIAEDTP